MGSACSNCNASKEEEQEFNPFLDTGPSVAGSQRITPGSQNVIDFNPMNKPYMQRL